MATMRVADVVERLRQGVGATGADPKFEGLVAGSGEERISGIATCAFPTVAVLRRAITADCRFVLADGHPLYTYDAVWDSIRGTEAAIAASPVARAKASLIAEGRLAVARFPSAVSKLSALSPGVELARTLGFGNPQPRAGFATALVNATTLERLAGRLARTSAGTRIVGRPDLRVRRVALVPGLATPALLRAALADPAVEAVVAGEVNEWEGGPYFEDAIAAGRNAGLILIGFAASMIAMPELLAGLAAAQFPGLRVVALGDDPPLRGA